ncbi:VanZ family protein [Paenibacillus sp. GSMTC-2017]|uniref:VanZ family protein n=1 Tax=Paenibacillus sp. GSMTC-2017 TaxID=2794350 RepID=UPI0018D5C0F6|nr:VanZ family protein [Paenibacillus sp. GSMTC-2017]MBH5316801.1 VanZ family protein [Paenibacillus sp. GSMTC-2017]
MNQINTQKKSKNWTRLLRFIPAIIWMTIIFILSSRTGDEISTVLPLFQKLFPGMTDFNWGHYVSYFILAAAFDYGFGKHSERLSMKLVIILLCGLYGVTDEFHQSFVGGRMMDITDVRNDMIGAAIWTVCGSIPFVRRIWRRYF